MHPFHGKSWFSLPHHLFRCRGPLDSFPASPPALRRLLSTGVNEVPSWNLQWIHQGEALPNSQLSNGWDEILGMIRHHLGEPSLELGPGCSSQNAGEIPTFPCLLGILRDLCLSKGIHTNIHISVISSREKSRKIQLGRLSDCPACGSWTCHTPAPVP